MKVLMFLEEDKLSPRGGPYGVGYYYYKEAKECGDDIIEFIPGESTEKNTKSLKRYSKYIPSFLISIRRSWKRIIGARKLFSENDEIISDIDFNKYDIIHFQATIHLFQQRKKLESYKGIVILSSHSPVPMSQEIIGSFTKFERKMIRNCEKKYCDMDVYAFNRADYLVFPCPEAEEPYYHAWSQYSQISKKKKYKYVATGIAPAHARHGRLENRRSMNIDNSDFVISFVGRHNEVKGYDNLKRIGEEFLRVHKDAWFVVCGKEEPLKGLSNEHWIEIGWTDDQYSYINSSDVFILPNKETYFDLVMLEVLSLGKIVIASRTGGNKYFERKKLKGVMLYDTIDQAISLLNNVKNMTQEERDKLGAENKQFYMNNLTSKQMYNNYIDSLHEIIKERCIEE